MRALVAPLLAGLALSACGSGGEGGFSAPAQCSRRCEILFACLDLPTGPSDRDRQEFGECVDSCVEGLARDCERETAFECLDCWERRTCDEVTTGRCDHPCTGACENPSPGG